MPDVPTPDFDDPKEVLAFFGLAVFAANLLESSFINWTVALRLGTISGATRQDFDTAFGHFETRTLGQLLKATHLLTAIPAGMDLVLTRALSERNRLIHHFFREHAANATHPAGKKAMKVELSSMIELFDHADELVTPIYHSLWERFGVDEAMIERELTKLILETEARYSAL
ncbi:hypothetical protein [Stenotrophomonas sp. CFBP 13718]|uniref:hypothetical protein n=1 Tax=Stenotrophomonas sp. CFBP 13718 TaxID=2775304 RepID=UPI001783EB69|nr:hypothetical protein [Stenotrophomonas sp. CFBP 13718]MBD8697039.1 hypothetical protein [Stenotrophomonas sp. CFBP 13718]